MYCQKCDRKLEPGHRCASRRFFLGALLGALTAPKLAQEAKRIGLVISEINYETKTVKLSYEYLSIGGVRVLPSPVVPKGEIWVVDDRLLRKGMEVEFYNATSDT